MQNFWFFIATTLIIFAIIGNSQPDFSNEEIVEYLEKQ